MTALEKKLQNKTCALKGKLPPEFKKKFLKALRSGEYHFVTGSLCKILHSDISAATGQKYGYCTLGVAGHILGKKPEDLLGKGQLDAIWEDVPEILKCGSPGAERIIQKNDGSISYGPAIKYIEENL